MSDRTPTEDEVVKGYYQLPNGNFASTTRDERRHAVDKIKAEAKAEGLMEFAHDLARILKPGMVIDGGRVIHMIADESKRIKEDANGG